MKAVAALKVGDKISPRFVIDRGRVSVWKYAAECPQAFAAVPPGSTLELFELSAKPGLAWVKAYLPSTHDTMFLKVSGEELALNFLLAVEFDVEAAVRELAASAGAASMGQCAKYVRTALEAGGLDTSQRPVSAKDYGPFLIGLGFASVPLGAYLPAKGDVAVIQSYPGGDVHGHIAMYDGNQWISDFKQRDMWGGPGYRQHKPSYAIYRP